MTSGSDGHVADGSKKKIRTKSLRLHHLPPDVLRDILSRLEFKEAARMSILSSKWRRLWRCYQNLVFTRETMFSSGSNAIRNRRRFISNVNSVLHQLRGSWGDDHESRYNFPLHHFSGSNGSPVRSLSLMFVCLKPLPDFCGFANLKKLKLDAVSIPGHLQCVLPNCAVLVWLSIVRCTLHGLQTSQPLCRLRYLHVQACSGMQKIELQAPNLATFKFHDSPMPIVLSGCLNIADVTVTILASSDCFDYAFTELPSGIPHVRKLSMELTLETKMQRFTKCPTVFFNLRHLVLTMEIFRHYEHTGGILRLGYLMELAPILEQLELHMEWHGKGEIILQLEDILPQRPHNHLKVLHMTGVYGYQSLLDLALYIASNATALERMVIDPMVKKDDVLTRHEEAQCAVHWGRQMAKQHLLGRGLDGILTIL